MLGWPEESRVEADSLSDYYEAMAATAINTALVACWLLLTWGAIAAIANATVLDRLERYRAQQIVS